MTGDAQQQRVADSFSVSSGAEERLKNQGHGRARLGRFGRTACDLLRRDGSSHPFMARLTWTDEALHWLEDIYEHIAEDNFSSIECSTDWTPLGFPA